MARHVNRRRREEPRTSWKVALVLWIAFIWVHSMIPGAASSEESMLFVRILKPLFSLIGITDTDTMQLVMRKSAHFGEYALLAVLCVVALRPRLKVPLWPAVLTALVWVGVPSIDEFIQLHVPGRAGSVVDVLIDMAGFGVGLGASLLARRIVEARLRAQAERERRARQARAARYRRKAREAAYARAGKPMPQSARPAQAPQPGGQPKHAPGVPVVPRGRHERITVEPESNRRRFEERTR